jgi:hypothetical protein
VPSRWRWPRPAWPACAVATSAELRSHTSRCRPPARPSPGPGTASDPRRRGPEAPSSGIALCIQSPINSDCVHAGGEVGAR